jgi:hypothetical protein
MWPPHWCMPRRQIVQRAAERLPELVVLPHAMAVAADVRHVAVHVERVSSGQRVTRPARHSPSRVQPPRQRPSCPRAGRRGGSGANPCSRNDTTTRHLPPKTAPKRKAPSGRKPLRSLSVRPTGFEPVTSCSGGPIPALANVGARWNHSTSGTASVCHRWRATVGSAPRLSPPRPATTTGAPRVPHRPRAKRLPPPPRPPSRRAPDFPPPDGPPQAAIELHTDRVAPVDPARRRRLRPDARLRPGRSRACSRARPRSDPRRLTAGATSGRHSRMRFHLPSPRFGRRTPPKTPSPAPRHQP